MSLELECVCVFQVPTFHISSSTRFFPSQQYIVKLKQFVVVGVKLDGIPMCNGCTRTGSVEQRADVVGPPPRASTFS